MKSCRDYLNGELARRIQVNPRYSQRAFARHLGLSPGELSEVLRGKRNLSERSALRVSRSMGLTPDETRDLLVLCQAERNRDLFESSTLAETPRSARELSLDLFHVISDWYCFAILHLADTKDFRFDPGWIAARLGISSIEAKLGLERLERVGLIERTRAGLRVSTEYVLSPSGIPSEAIRAFHKRMLQKAKESIDLQPAEDRDITGIGFAANPRHVKAIREEIAAFQEMLVRKYSPPNAKDRTEVYQMEIALFRVTEGKRK